ncbi:MAG: hypothetical protein AB1297_05545 [bacterium]
MMDLEGLWEKAKQETEILRQRVSYLSSIENTILDYIFLAESSVNLGDTIVRSGKILVHKPLIILPREVPIFEGFEFEDDIAPFFLMRGIQFPSLKYSNITSSIEVYEGPLSKAIDDFMERLTMKEDISTGLIKGLSDIWQFSLLLYVGSLVMRSAPSDIKRAMDDFRKRINGYGFG